ncbi:MAG: hypothetical protein AAGD14_10920 [Planctomycetota bacterium]
MIRATAVFLAAVLLATVTVSGQEGEAEKLRERIRALTELLEQRADAEVDPAREAKKPRLRVYDVADLCKVTYGAQPEAVYLVPSKFTPPEQSEPAWTVRGFEIDALIDMVRSTIEPASWETIEGAEIQVKTGRLFIYTIDRVHKKIERFLKRLRGVADRRLTVEITAVPVTEADWTLLGNRPRELTDAEAKAMTSRKALGRARIQGQSGMTLTQRFGRKVSYLMDYDVEIAQEASIGDPIRRSAFDGTIVNLMPMLDESANGVRLDVQLYRSHIPKPIRRVDTEHGPLELPTMELTKVQSSAWYPLGKTCIVGGGLAGDTPCVFLVKVTRKPRG